MKIKKGDTVKVLYGNDSGKTGKVLDVDSKKNRIVVDGVNTKRKHIKGDGQQRKSEVVTIVKPMPVSKVMVVDPNSGKASRIRYEIKSGGKERVAVKSGKSIDKVESKKKTTKKKTTKKTAKKSTKKTAKKTTKAKNSKKKTSKKSSSSSKSSKKK